MGLVQLVFLTIWLLFIAVLAPFLWAAESDIKVKVLYLGQEYSGKKPLALVQQITTDGGLPGIRLAMDDNATTGQFLGHQYQLDELIFPHDADNQQLIDAVNQTDKPFVIVDLPAKQLLAIVDGLDPIPRRLFFNVRDKSIALREQHCRTNVLHILPDRAMLADALAQYLLVKRWNKWLLVVGKHANDRAYADAIENAAKKFNAKIVAKEEWRFEYGGRLVDSGHVTAKQEVSLMTQARGENYDVVVVADEDDNFGEYLPYQTYIPRPVVGTQGLIATAWHRANELWGATQIQRRFSKQANGRYMTERDYAAWVAGRALGEAVTRINSTDVDAVRTQLLSNEFQLAAFKGVALNFRNWNGQLRQPILLAAPRMLVSVSPQAGFLHQFSALDTLGLDRPQTRCGAFKN